MGQVETTGIFDLLIKNGIVICMDSQGSRFENGAVAVEGGRISAVGPGHEFENRKAARILDAGGGIIMPGLVNSHLHLPMTIFRGLADDLPLETWLQEYMFPAEAQFINPETVQLGALLGAAELLLSGTTTCCDGYFYEDQVARAIHASGLRAVLGQGVIDFPAPGVPDPKDNVGSARRFLELMPAYAPLIRPSVFCHSPYTCSADTLTQAKASADAAGALFQIHVAETLSETKNSRSEHGLTPVQYLDRLGVIDRNTLLVHCVWLDEEDIRIVAEREAAVAHNPESNMKLASGIAPIVELLKSGITVGLGTDGCASNNNLDLFAEMDFAAKLHKVAAHDPTVMKAETVLEMATISGARAIGLENDIGSLEKGKFADVIIIDSNKPHLVPMYHPVSQLVYTTVGADVRDVVIAGQVVVEDRRLATIDLDDVLSRAAALAGRIRPV